jgi:hypothetical protein
MSDSSPFDGASLMAPEANAFQGSLFVARRRAAFRGPGSERPRIIGVLLPGPVVFEVPAKRPRGVVKRPVLTGTAAVCVVVDVACGVGARIAYDGLGIELP